jgi:hypothetical protein
MMIQKNTVAVLLATAVAFGMSLAANAGPVKNIVLVHGAWVDGSGWRGCMTLLSPTDTTLR